MKIDKHVKDLSKRLDSISLGSGNSNNNDRTNIIDEHDDEYYLDSRDVPNRFILYRAARREKLDERVQKTFEGVNDTITQDELDNYLKAKLRVPPEQRYQDKKEDWFFHESSWSNRGLDATGYDGQGCNQFTGCILECRFYPEYGRIEDEEVIEEHNKVVESYRQRNAIVEPPSESELLRLAKTYHSS